MLMVYYNIGRQYTFMILLKYSNTMTMEIFYYL